MDTPQQTVGEKAARQEHSHPAERSEGTTLLDVQPSGDGYAATFSVAMQV